MVIQALFHLPLPRLSVFIRSPDQFTLVRVGLCPFSILLPCGDLGIHVGRIRMESMLYFPRAGHESNVFTPGLWCSGFWLVAWQRLSSIPSQYQAFSEQRFQSLGGPHFSWWEGESAFLTSSLEPGFLVALSLSHHAGGPVHITIWWASSLTKLQPEGILCSPWGRGFSPTFQASLQVDTR